MQKSFAVLMLSILLLAAACGKAGDGAEPNPSRPAADGGRPDPPQSGDASQKVSQSPMPDAPGKQLRTIRDFFMALPEKYFVLEGCIRETDKDCRKAKLDYLKTFTQVEDVANGYLKGGCDGGQSCLEMTIFKRPDGTYLVAVSTESEMMIEQYFLDYDGSQWADVSEHTVPEFKGDKIYQLPRHGTKVEVFAKKVIEKGENYEAVEKGSKLYDLIWKDGKFSISK